MKAYVKGTSTQVNLTTTNFLAGGGEGQVYVIGDTAYKIYDDPSKMIAEGKIADLAAIAEPRVIRPKDILCNSKGKNLGYTMRYVQDTYAMCQLFPRSFREREGLDHDKALTLVRSIQKTLDAIHAAKILVVDLNEMNLLVSKDFTGEYWIDVDSYQTARYPATAIMPSVRDPLTKKSNDFTELSDWFSFGILAFQLFIGIHPYKGKHPTVKGFEERMEKRISVFDPSVGVPKVCYSFDVIPEAYRNWFKAVFQEGKRFPPPKELQAAVVAVTTLRQIQSSAKLSVKQIRSWAHDIQTYAYFSSASEAVQLADSTLHVGNLPAHSVKSSVVVGSSPVSNTPISAWVEGRSLHLRANKEQLQFNLSVDSVSSSDGRLYVKSGGAILELVITEAQNADGTPKFIVSTRDIATVMLNASHLFSGGVYQNMLGAAFFNLFPRSKASYQVRVPELDGFKFIEGKFESGVLMVVASKDGKYSRFILRFTPDYVSYDTRVVSNIALSGLNFVVLDSGVCVCLTEEENLELFSATKGSSTVKVVEDSILGGDMRLIKRGGSLGFIRGNSLYEMKMV